jgi:hypothetical protein
MRAAQAEYFDLLALRPRTGVSLWLDVRLDGDPAAGSDEVAVWSEIVSMTDSRGDRIGYRERRFAFDRRTGLTVDCCGGYIGADLDVRQAGLAVRWPIDAAKRDRDLYDPLLRRAYPAVFDGEDTVDGLPVHRYVQRIAAAKVGDRVDPMPAAALGLPGRAPVAVSHYAALTRVVWVEPRSGMPVKTTEDRDETLRTADGVARVTLLRARFSTEEDDVRAQVAVAERFAGWVRTVREVLPPVCYTGGPLLLVLGAIALRGRRRSAIARGSALVLRGRGRSELAQHEQQVPGDDLPDPGEADDAGRPARVVAGEGGDDPDR